MRSKQTAQLKVAIYHFTNKSEKRPIVNQKKLNSMVEYAEKRGWYVEKIYCDYSLKKALHPEFKLFLEECEKYDILLIQDYYHLNKTPLAVMDMVKYLEEKGVEVRTTEDGRVLFEDPPLNKKLKIATYCCKYGYEYPKDNGEALDVTEAVYRLFVKKKTAWKIIDQYKDLKNTYCDADQVALYKLIKNRKKYDLLMLDSIEQINRRTAKFMKRIRDLNLDIYSLKDGFIRYKEND